MTVNRQEKWDGLDFTRSQVLIRRLSRSVLPMDQLMQTLETAQFGAGSGLEKRQCTVLLTLFADGKARVKPLIIFRGKGKQISFREKVG